MTLEDAATHYAKMLYPGVSDFNEPSAHYISARADFIAGAEWNQKQHVDHIAYTAKSFKSIINLCEATLSLIETKTS